ncbi:MAG: hypothetical protein QNK04_00425 [Myxococcota bacterium]|nr:hypothetical protein [Myxococcota bacterium]
MRQSDLRAFAAGGSATPRGAGDPLARHVSGAGAAFPERYRVRRGEDDSQILCEEAPRIQVRVRRDYAFSEAQARELGERVILLDGAATFGPLLDNKRRLYNLDHHQGCERTFTLATCEQALLLVHSGLELTSGDWSIYANEPDLDTVMAIWCLLNHARLRDLSSEARDVLFPLIRLEGAIDANGSQLAEVCGLPSDVRRSAQGHLDDLLTRERQVRVEDGWNTIDLEAYTAEMLGAMDRIVYTAEDFRGYASLAEVYGHAEIVDGGVAVVCHDASGIYAVEKLLKERWGDQLALIALEKSPGHYTLRRSAALADIRLEDAYELLNLLDPRVDGRPPGKRWGGSDSIGGSPRPSGSAFTPAELLRVLQRVYQPPGRWQRLVGAARVASLTGGVGIFALLATIGLAAIPEVAEQLRDAAARVAAFSLVVGLTSMVLSSLTSRRRLWLHGYRRPAGGDWLPLALVAALTALPLRAWFPTPTSLEPIAVATTLAGVAFAAFGLEAWFRGLAHGTFQEQSRTQWPGGPWRISATAWLSAVLYTLVVTGVSAPALFLFFEASPWLTAGQEVGLVAACAAVGGLALAVVRERSLSIWPGVAAQLLGGLACVAAWTWLVG